MASRDAGRRPAYRRVREDGREAEDVQHGEPRPDVRHGRPGRALGRGVLFSTPIIPY